MHDTDRCPRCGQLNSCAQTGHEQPVQDCWCFHTLIKQSALDELPAELRDQTCLCPNCARALSDTGH